MNGTTDRDQLTKLIITAVILWTVTLVFGFWAIGLPQ
jgi:hypothetical protein